MSKHFSSRPSVVRIFVDTGNFSTTINLEQTQQCSIVVSDFAAKREILRAAIFAAISGAAQTVNIERSEFQFNKYIWTYPGRCISKQNSLNHLLNLSLGQAPLFRIKKRLKDSVFSEAFTIKMISLSDSQLVAVECHKRKIPYVKDGQGRSRPMTMLTSRELEQVKLAVQLTAFAAGKIPFIILSQESFDLLGSEGTTRLLMEIVSMPTTAGKVILLTTLQTILGFPLRGYGSGNPSIVDMDENEKDGRRLIVIRPVGRKTNESNLKSNRSRLAIHNTGSDLSTDKPKGSKNDHT